MAGLNNDDPGFGIWAHPGNRAVACWIICFQQYSHLRRNPEVFIGLIRMRSWVFMRYLSRSRFMIFFLISDKIVSESYFFFLKYAARLILALEDNQDWIWLTSIMTVAAWPGK